MGLLKQQPFKSLYLMYRAATTAFISLPFWTVIYASPFLRPRRQWSLLRTLRVKLLQTVVRVGSVGITHANHTALVAGAKGTWIEPIPEEFITGDIKSMATAAGARPIRLPGYWLDKEGSDIPIGKSPSSGEKVLYHLHGGGYRSLSANPGDPTAAISRGLLKYGEDIQRVCSIEYRLASVEGDEFVNPFPTALIDALTGYYYLVKTVRIPPEDIIVEGDSAGGHLALSLLRYLVEFRGHSNLEALPTPGRLVLLSPWVDLSTSHEVQGSSYFTCLNSDYLSHEGIHNGVNIVVGPFGSAAADVNSYISPASLHPSLKISFKGFPKTFLAAGGAEVLRDQIRTLKSRMERDLGDQAVTYYEPPDAVHDFTVFHWHEPERTDTLRRIGEWLSA